MIREYPEYTVMGVTEDTGPKAAKNLILLLTHPKIKLVLPSTGSEEIWSTFRRCLINNVLELMQYMLEIRGFNMTISDSL